MQTILKSVVILFTAGFIASCGTGSKTENAELNDKKARLEELKGELKNLNTEIATLENEIAMADPDAMVGRAKLVAVMPLKRQDFTHYIELQGRVDAENISYATPRGGPGLVKSVYVKEGQYVKKGQLLLKLDDAVIQQNISQLESQLEYARDLFNRQKNLWDQGIGTEVQFITARNNVTNLEKQLNILREQRQLTEVRAEVSGVADQVMVHPGETFTGAPQQGIRIVNTSQMQAIADIPENYVTRVKRGTPVEIVIPDLNNRVINSTISRVSETINLNSRGFQIEARIPSDPSLKPNQVATVKILDYRANNVIAVPVNVVQTDEKGKYVFVMVTEDGKTVARKKYVIPGESYRDLIEIRDGLTEDVQLVIQGYQNLYEGQLIATEPK